MKNRAFGLTGFLAWRLRIAGLRGLSGLLKCSAAIVYAMAVGWLLSPDTVSGNPCVYPKRMVNGYAVDLRPLMEWWAEPKGLRPLSGWKHVRGTITEDTALGWVMTGKTAGQGSVSKFFLKNPPRQRLLRFQEIKGRLPELDQVRAATQEAMQQPVRSLWDLARMQPQPGPVLTVAEHKAAAERLRLLDQEIQGLRAELAPMQDEEGNFRLDAFALRLNEQYRGLPVYDHGYPMEQL